jgi:hypothetical protein
VRNVYRPARLKAVKTLGGRLLYVAPEGWEVHTVHGMDIDGSALEPKVMVVTLHQLNTDGERGCDG